MWNRSGVGLFELIMTGGGDSIVNIKMALSEIYYS